MLLRYLNQLSLLSVTQVLWKYLWEHGVQAINILLCEDFLSSDIILLLWSSLSSLQNNQEFFILFHFPQRSDKSEENEDSKVNRKEEYKNGREKEGRENGNVNHHTTEQPSKKRKEDFSESKSVVKKPSPEKTKVCKPFDYHVYFFCYRINQYC